MSSTAAPPTAPIQVLLDDVLEIPDEQFAAMSPIAELIVGELLAFEFTRPDLTATLAASEFEPTFHEHSHNLRELYASGYQSIEVRSLCTSIVEHMPIGSEAFWQHLDSVEQLKSTISDNVGWLSNVEVNDKRDAAYIASALLVAFRTPSLQSRKLAHHVGVYMHHSARYIYTKPSPAIPHCSVESTKSLGLVSNIVIQELFPTQASSGVFTNRNSRGEARIFFLNGHRVFSCLDTHNSSMQTVEAPAGFGFDGHTWRVLDPQAQARYHQLESFIVSQLLVKSLKSFYYD